MNTYTRLTYNHIGKTDFCVDIGYGQNSINFPFLFLLLSFCPTQGHPIKASGTHSNTCPTIWIKERSNQGPHSKCIIIPLHAPISTARTSLYSSSILSILLTRTYCLPQCSHWCNGNQIQQLQISISSTYHPLKIDLKKKKDLLRIVIKFSYHAFHRPTIHNSIQCRNFLNHPLFVVDLFHIIHKQTKLPTHAHKFH